MKLVKKFYVTKSRLTYFIGKKISPEVAFFFKYYIIFSYI